MRSIWFSSSRNPVRLTFLVSLLVSLAACTFSYSPRPKPSLPNAPVLSPLNDWLYRGSQPLKSNFLDFKRKGIRTIISFREERGWIDWERKEVKRLGMKYVSLPWSILKPVDPSLLDKFFEVLDNPKNRPVLFHCRHGRDRSGVMATLALMRYEKMTEEEAREIALETIRPHRRYQFFVERKIRFFLEKRPQAFQESSVS